MSWELNKSLTQKDTMDRGAWIKKFRNKGMRRTQKDKKSKSTKKCVKWHGNEEQMNISIYHMLRSCGVQAGSYPKTEVKIKLIFLALKELSWLWNLGFHFPELDYPQWLKVHIFSIWEIHTSRRIQHVVFIVKTVCYLRKKLSRDLGSPSSRQLLQLQLFSPNFQILDPPFMI